MSLVRSASAAVLSNLTDQWRVSVVPAEQGPSVIVTPGRAQRGGREPRLSPGGASGEVLRDGSLIHVHGRQAMLVVAEGRITEFCALPGAYRVSFSGAPTLLSGDLRGTLRDSWERFAFAGGTPRTHEVVYVNLMEFPGLRFGTSTPLSYFDSSYGVEHFIRLHGTFSIAVVDPILFYQEVVAKQPRTLRVQDLSRQYADEVVQEVQVDLSELSGSGVRVSELAAQASQVAERVRTRLTERWLPMRGLMIRSLTIPSISYDAASRAYLDMRAEGAALADPNIREGYVQGHLARGLEAAGSNPNGALNGFVGLGVGFGQQGTTVSGGGTPAPGKSAFCTQCGERFASDAARFCGGCGAPRG